jgi:hypothetical protein
VIGWCIRERGEVAGGVGATGRECIEAGANLFVEFDPGRGVTSAFEETETDVDLAGERIGLEIERFAVAGEICEITSLFGFGDRFVDCRVPFIGSGESSPQGVVNRLIVPGQCSSPFVTLFTIVQRDKDNVSSPLI